VICNDEDTDMT